MSVAQATREAITAIDVEILGLEEDLAEQRKRRERLGKLDFLASNLEHPDGEPSVIDEIACESTVSESEGGIPEPEGPSPSTTPEDDPESDDTPPRAPAGSLTTSDRVLAFVKGNPEYSGAEIGEALDIAQPQISKATSELEAAGLITSEKVGRSKRWRDAGV